MTIRPKMILCGDSILDNGAYVGVNGRSVHSHLVEFATAWAIDFRAIDGAVCADVAASQLNRSDEPADAIVLSVGGNDALGHLPLLQDPQKLMFMEFALNLADLQAEFRANYRTAFNRARAHDRRMLVLTIYRPRFHLDGYPSEIQTAVEPLLSVFNDVIQEEARSVSADVLDLRTICTSDADFANAIEPSDTGGRKIAAEISAWFQKNGPGQ